MTVDNNGGKGNSSLMVVDGKDNVVAITGVENGNKKNGNGKFESEMKEGKYLQILETYPVHWKPDKVARDVLQNFFDGNGGTLDGIEVNIKENEDGDNMVRIDGFGQYDYRKLIHLGGSSKIDNADSVGGFGEGTKIMSLVMLRDMGIEEIKFGSNDWQLKFYLNDVDEDSYDEKIRGLFVKLDKVSTPIDGNFIEFKIPKDNDKKEEYLEVFSNASDLFKHSSNPDFQNSIFENEDFGIVFLGDGDDDKGNYYDGGQRRHVINDSWQTIKGFNIWTNKPCFKNDRDRGIINEYQLRDEVLNPMFNKLDVKDVAKILFDLEKIWIPKNKYSYYDITGKVINSLVQTLQNRGEKLVFTDNYFSDNGEDDTKGFVESLKQKGYKICDICFGNIGMKTVNEQFIKEQEYFKKEPNAEQQRKINLLQSTTKMILKRDDILYNDLLPLKPIWIYDKKHEKSIFGGQYKADFIWIADSNLSGSLSYASSIYLHELCHFYGDDESSKFSYALTDCQTAVIEFFMGANEEENKEIEKLKKEWGGFEEKKSNEVFFWIKLRISLNKNLKKQWTLITNISIY